MCARKEWNNLETHLRFIIKKCYLIKCKFRIVRLIFLAKFVVHLVYSSELHRLSGKFKTFVKKSIESAISFSTKDSHDFFHSKS